MGFHDGSWTGGHTVVRKVPARPEYRIKIREFKKFTDKGKGKDKGKDKDKDEGKGKSKDKGKGDSREPWGYYAETEEIVDEKHIRKSGEKNCEVLIFGHDEGIG